MRSFAGPGMLFNFALRRLEDIEPWGADRTLHWFGLTDGWYWLRVGEATLFEYTNAVITTPVSAGDRPFVRYVDYYVTRLWEDVRGLLPDALEPIPADVIVDRQWAEKVAAVHHGLDDGAATVDLDSRPELDQTIVEATLWWGSRQLDTGYLKAGPLTHIWREAETVTVAWDTRRCRFNGTQTWTAGAGRTTFPVDVFLGEVVDFRRRLTAAMQERVDYIRVNGPPACVQIDVDALVVEQAERFVEPEGYLARQASMNWDRVRAAICEVRRCVPELTRSWADGYSRP